MPGADPAVTDPPIRVGRYEVLGEIASGGMATVYLARSVGAAGFSRLVAIKKLHEHLQADEEFVAMLLDEARLAARIRHPNVVPVVDMEASPSLYLVMEYIEGDKLSGLIKTLARKNQRLPIPVALRIAHDTLEGLHAAHELADEAGKPLRIIHRDVSPQNILVGIDGVSRITDFGIAKAESRATATRDGELKGKVGYMAPEQLGADEIDRRVDLFAMGVTLWESLAGRRLFHRDTEVESMAAVATARIPSLMDVPYRVPAEIDAVVRRSLERKPHYRFATARAFADALEAAARTVGGMASTRTVADLVESVSDEKIQRERARTREAIAFSTTTPISRTGIASPAAVASAASPAPATAPAATTTPTEHTVVSGVDLKRDEAREAVVAAAAKSGIRWSVIVPIVAVVLSSLLTAALVSRLRGAAPAAPRTVVAAAPVVTPPAPIVIPAPGPATPPVAVVVEHDAALAPPTTQESADAGARTATSHSHGSGGRHPHDHVGDDSEFLGVNPYQH